MKKQKKQNVLFPRLSAVAILCIIFAFVQASPIFASDDPTDDAASPSVDAAEATGDEGTEGASSEITNTVTGDIAKELDEDEEVTPNFTNAAQAAHASQLADEVASRGNEETVEALENIEAAEEALEDAMATDDPDAIENAQQELAEAEEAYAKTVSELTGVITQDIADMRASGRGWGNIAHELGVHPSLLGLGHTKGKQKASATAYAEPQDGIIAGSIQASEVAEATARNTRSGWAKGHGLGMNTGVHSPGTGLASGVSSKGGGKGKQGGIGGASGLGSGQGKGKGGSDSSGPGNSGNSSGGQGVAGKDGNPGGGKGGSSNGHGGGKDKGGKDNNGKGGDKGGGKGNSKK